VINLDLTHTTAAAAVYVNYSQNAGARAQKNYYQNIDNNITAAYAYAFAGRARV